MTSEEKNDPPIKVSACFKCNEIRYRKGFIEVVGGIHDGCINLETWGIHPDVDISSIDRPGQTSSDDEITGNTELEMSVETAEALVKALQAAICELRTRS